MKQRSISTTKTVDTTLARLGTSFVFPRSWFHLLHRDIEITMRSSFLLLVSWALLTLFGCDNGSSPAPQPTQEQATSKASQNKQLGRKSATGRAKAAPRLQPTGPAYKAGIPKSRTDL
jgi:hypothetical protein